MGCVTRFEIMRRLGWRNVPLAASPAEWDAYLEQQHAIAGPWMFWLGADGDTKVGEYGLIEWPNSKKWIPTWTT